jgi:DNA primase
MSKYKYGESVDTSKLSAIDAAIVKKSVEDICSDLIPVSRRSGTNISCPFHDDTTPSFQLNKDGTGHCHSGKHPIDKKNHYDSVSIVADYYNLSQFDAAKLICDTYNIEYNKSLGASKKKEMPEGYYKYIDVLKYVHEILIYHRDCIPLADENTYFISRGFDKEFIEAEGLVYCRPYYTKPDNTIYNWRDIILQHFPDLDSGILDSYGLYNKYGELVFSDRYLFPIKDSLGNIVGFSGRSLDPEKPKYYNTKDNTFFKKGQLLYNYYSIKNLSKDKPIYIVEGFVDALALKFSGVPNVVATMGTALTEEHLSMLGDRKIVLAFDNDKAGLNTMYGWALDHNMKFLLASQTFKYKDFGEALQDGFDLKTYIANHKPITSPELAFVWLKDYLDLSDLDERSIMWETLGKITKRYNPVVRDYIAIKYQRLIKGKRRQDNDK